MCKPQERYSPGRTQTVTSPCKRRVKGTKLGPNCLSVR
nr:MAG TPA: hypothetical protein [Bacteriophage sp.]